MQWTFNGQSAGASMATAAEFFGYGGNIEGAFAPQADAEPSFRQFAEEDGDFDIANRQRVIDEAFTVFFSGADPLHLLLSDPDPGQRSLALQRGKRGAQQPKLRGGMAKIQGPGTTHRVSTRKHKLARKLKSVGV